MEMVCNNFALVFAFKAEIGQSGGDDARKQCCKYTDQIHINGYGNRRCDHAADAEDVRKESLEQKEEGAIKNGGKEK